jgi:hypothetical protein
VPRSVRRRRFSTLILGCVAVPAALIAGCGGGGGSSDVDVGPAAAVPANTPVYLDATVEPTGTAESDAKAALGKVLDTNDPGARIVSLIEDAAKKEGHPINFDQDVKPWLGKQAAVFFPSLSGDTTNGTVVLETTDPSAALAAIQKSLGATATNPPPQSYNGSSYQADPTNQGQVFGTVGDFLVEGDLAGFKAAVDAQNGDSLGDSSEFKDALGKLPDERLGTFYTVPKTLLDSIGPDQIDRGTQAFLEQSAGDALDKPVSGALTASANSFNLEFIGGDNGVETPESSLLGDVPSQSWLALGIGNLGDVVKRTLDQAKDQIPNYDSVVQQIESTTGSSIDQLTGAFGDAVVYVEGTTESTLTGALVVKTEDPDLTGRLISQLQGLLQLGSGGVKRLQLSGGGTGFQVNDPSLAPVPVEIAQQGDELVIGYGANSAERTLAPAQTLADAATFSTAQGDVSDLGTDFFLDFPSVFQLAESEGAKSDSGYVQAKPYIDALSYLVSGSGSEDDQTEVKAVLGLK